MEQKLSIFKADFRKVFVKGDANNLQMTRVFLVLAIPVIVTILVLLQAIKF